MDCLIDYIGLLGCGDTVPESGLYVNSLPGISLESIEKLADAEQKTYLGVWADVQLRASKRFQIDVINQLADRYKLRQLSQSVDLLKFIDDSVLTPGEAKYFGWTASLASPQHFVGSSFHCYYFQELRFYSVAAVTGAIFKIFDSQLGIELFTKTQDLVIGWNRIPVNKRFIAYNVSVAVDGTNITNFVEQDISQDALYHFGCGCNHFYGDCNASIKGATFEDSTDPDYGDSIFGLSAIFSVQCNYYALICNNRDHFAYSFWYLLGNELMVERLSSSRRNFFTMIQTETAKELKESFFLNYKSTLKTAMNGVDLDLNDCCIECNQAVQVVYPSDIW